MNKQGAFRGIIWFVILLALLILAYFFYVRSRTLDLRSYNLSDFETDLEAGVITEVEIKQNEEIPTGVVSVRTNENQEKGFYASDVNEIIQMIQEQNRSGEQQEEIEITIEDVARQSTFSLLLPYVILLLIVMIFMFVMMLSLQNSGGGGRMMDFGKAAPE